MPGARGAPNRADPRRRLDADVDRRRRFQFFGLSFVQLEDALGRYWPLASCLPFGETLISWRYSASQGAQTLSGICATVGEDRIVEMNERDSNPRSPQNGPEMLLDAGRRILLSRHG